FTVPELFSLAKANMDLITELHAVIDGVAVSDLFTHRVVSPVFSIDFASTNNLLSYGFGQPVIGLLDPMVAEAYALMLEPLAPGTHVINFGGTVGPPVNLVFDQTDIITIVPIPLAQRMQNLISMVSGSSLPSHRQQPLLATLNAAAASFHSKNLRAGINQ